MKLELKHIQHYPIGGKNGLKGIMERYSYPRAKEQVTLTYSLMDSLVKFPKKYSFVPILHPMSDLYKEINGKVGIVELAKICIDWDWKLGEYEDINDTYVDVAEFYSSYFFWNPKYKLFEIANTYGVSDVAFNQLDLFEYLFANHYDVFGLIDQGLAIDINTIEQ